MTKRSVSIYGVHFDTQGRVLLVQDSHSHQWGFPGGGIETGESHAGALRREFLEETGLTALGYFTYITDQNDDAKERYFYAVPQVGGKLLAKGNDSDTEKVDYVLTADLHRLFLAPGVAIIINEYRAIGHQTQ